MRNETTKTVTTTKTVVGYVCDICGDTCKEKDIIDNGYFTCPEPPYGHLEIFASADICVKCQVKYHRMIKNALESIGLKIRGNTYDNPAMLSLLKESILTTELEEEDY